MKIPIPKRWKAWLFYISIALFCCYIWLIFETMCSTTNAWIILLVSSPLLVFVGVGCIRAFIGWRNDRLYRWQQERDRLRELRRKEHKAHQEPMRHVLIEV